MLQSAIKQNSIMPSRIKKQIPLTKKVLGKKDFSHFTGIINEKLSEFNGSVEHLMSRIREKSGNNSIPGNVNEHGSHEESKLINSILCERDSIAIIGMIKALERIKNHTYGICPECTKINHPKINFTETSILEKISTIRRNSKNFIEYERLIAFPAAKTCIIHAKK